MDKEMNLIGKSLDNNLKAIVDVLNTVDDPRYRLHFLNNITQLFNNILKGEVEFTKNELRNPPNSWTDAQIFEWFSSLNSISDLSIKFTKESVSVDVIKGHENDWHKFGKL